VWPSPLICNSMEVGDVMNTDQFYEQRLNDRIKELMAKGGDYYPFDTDNFANALENIEHNKMVSLCALTEADQLQAGLFLRKLVVDRWTYLATTQARSDIEKEYNLCEYCHGMGCRQCNEDQRMEHRE